MIVNRYSFSFVFEDFKKTLEGCDFYAVDQEMTGVNFGEQSRSWTMSLSELYGKCREVVNQYIAFQFGVTIFTRTKENFYEVKPYNFYLLNKSGNFLVDGDAIAFLSSHKMDYQTWLLSGMSYCNGKEEELFSSKEPNILYSEMEEKIASYIAEKIEKWYFDSLFLNDQTVTINSFITKDIETLVLFKLEKRRINVVLKWASKIFLYDKPVEILVSRVLAKNLDANVQKKADNQNEIAGGLQFRQFWKCLTECKKPVVGHHFWLDIMFMVQMHELPLPASYEAYKEHVHSLFPVVYDTRTLSVQITWGGLKAFTGLQQLFKACCKLNKDSNDPLVFFTPPGFHYYDEKYTGAEGRPHEAGYDAYMTGIVFAIIKDLYKGGSKFKLSRWENIISVFGSYYCMNLAGRDFLSNKATFLLVFEKDVDVNMVLSLLATEKDIENVKKSEMMTFNIKPGFDLNERGKTFTVQFENENINKDDVIKRVQLSTRRLDTSLQFIKKECVSIIPRLESIQRFEQ